MSRRALVTGSSRGIGRAVAERLSRDGLAVTLHCRARADAAEAVAAGIRAAGGLATLLTFDVADRAATAAALAADVEAHGPYYAVVSNAGVAVDAPFPALSGDDWDRVLRTNLDGFYNVLHPLVMPMVRARQGGRIVVMSSISGIAGNRGQVSYSASKAGLIGAARSLALELAKRKITVNTVAPGLIDTEMIQDLPIDEIARQIPMRRVGTASEVASLVSFLTSDEAAYITGQVVSINGGLA